MNSPAGTSTIGAPFLPVLFFAESAIGRGLVAVVRTSVGTGVTVGVFCAVFGGGFSEGAGAGGGVVTVLCVRGGSTVAGAAGPSDFTMDGPGEEPCDQIQ